MIILLNPEHAARLLGLTPAVLAAHRRAGTGPQCLRLTPRARPLYRLSDLALWATQLSSRASVGCARAYDAAIAGETDHDVLRQIAQQGADEGEAQFAASLDTSTRH